MTFINIIFSLLFLVGVLLPIKEDEMTAEALKDYVDTPLHRAVDALQEDLD